MQFGVFLGQRHHRDPVTGETPSEAQRIDAIGRSPARPRRLADVFAIGEHHNPPFFSSSPSTPLAAIAATTKDLVVTTSMTLITTNDPVRVAMNTLMLNTSRRDG